MKNKYEHMNLLYFSGLYPKPNDKRGMPFIEKRFDLIKEKKIASYIYFLIQEDSINIKKIKDKFRTINNNQNASQDRAISKHNKWKAFIHKNNLLIYFLKLFFRNIQLNLISNKIYKNLLKGKMIDLVHVHWAYPSGYIFSKIKKKFGIPYVLTLHGSDIHTIPYNDALAKKRTIEALEAADKCIFVSKSLKEKALTLGYSGANATVIANGYDPNYFYHDNKNKMKRQMGFKANKVVGFVGNLISVKNVLKLPSIFANIKEKYSDVEFIIIGDGELKSKLMDLFQKLNIDVYFTGNIDQHDVADFMRAMDVMILPSKSEGWPCVIKEAHACGTYVVGSNIPGVSEALKDTGKTFNLDKYFCLNCSEHIIETFRFGYDELKLIKSAQKYSWENIVQKEIKIYEEVLGK